MTITVAVTGGIGAGKSTVSGLLAARGAIVVDSDRLAREVVGPGTPGLAAVVDEFGTGVRLPDGSLDRGALASIVFADVSARRRLEAITHPAIRARFAELSAAATEGAVVVNDIPLLTSRSAAGAFYLVIGVGAPESTRLARLVGRGLAEPDARARIAAQISDVERRLLCDVWLDNGGGPAEMRRQADLIWARLVEFAGNVQAARCAPRSGPALVPYNPNWPAQAARLVARLHHLVGADHLVEHIGSTAVPGMPAKDVIDMQLAVADLDQADRLAAALLEGGFPRVGGIIQDVPHPSAGRLVDERHWQKRLHANADPGQSLNLHLRVRGAPNWTFALRFRDWLRANPDAARTYLQLKQGLADRFRSDATIAGYAQAKEEFLVQADEDSAAWAADIAWEPT